MQTQSDTLGDQNRLVGWSLFLAGIASGMLLGLWAFDGPFQAPERFADYAGVPRRLLRLAHIAAMALGLTNVFLGHEMPHLALSRMTRAIASKAMIVGGIAMPIVLTAASLDERFKYLLPIPATASFVAVALVCAGLARANKIRRAA